MPKPTTPEIEAEPNVLVLAEEVATVAKHDVVSGRVKVRTQTEAFERFVRESLLTETVEVTRVPIDREVTSAPAIRTEGDLTIVPILEEVLVVEKRLVLKEEVHIRRVTRSDTVETPVTLRRQRAVVERQNGAGTSYANQTDDTKETP